MPNQEKLSPAQTHKLYVKKFGGTSVGSIERIEVLAEQIAAAHRAGIRQVIVLSAMAGETNRLIALGGQIDPHGNAREMDMLISTGEQISIALMAMALQKRGVKAVSLTGDQVQIHTNSQFGRASIERVDTDYLESLLASDIIPVVAGFQGRNPHGDVTTLGRGGSDTTAVALAVALSADECQIYTDVCGVFTTDPNLEPAARRLSCISFTTMYEMARLGAKVLHPDSVAYAERFKVPLRVLSSFESGEGTLICVDEACHISGNVVGIAVSRDLAMVSFEDADKSTEPLGKLFQQLSVLGVETDLLSKTQTDSSSVSFTVSEAWLEQVLLELDGLSQTVNLGSVFYERDLVRISLVASGSLAKTDVAAKVFDVLGKLGIHVKLISTSEIKLALVIPQKYLQMAVCALHHAFGLNEL
ncbi:aspartokinase [Shewanella sp. NFH-SH190041]|uniref:aspartate kinase n=1 Tax=Shewanella sp. NFH-SH190041 TaxID=2950245 RepID=UPI0021C3BF9C|nr:aspartate kinase [Shewanella sp. NFH-SH190041]BDM65393.1 aspartokinase [Shewanella sp. NFH-SH190041]